MHGRNVDTPLTVAESPLFQELVNSLRIYPRVIDADRFISWNSGGLHGINTNQLRGISARIVRLGFQLKF
jgi:hypothetical protein